MISWVNDRRSAVLLGTIVPAALAATTTAAVWTALALAAPVIATGDGPAVVAIVAVGLVVAASRRGTGQRLLPLVLIASAGTALLIFLVITFVLPSVPGFVGNSHPPIYTPVTRMVDPIGELGIFVLLIAALGADVLRARIRRRRAAARDQRSEYGTGLNEMVVVERTTAAVQPGTTEAGHLGPA